MEEPFIGIEEVAEITGLTPQMLAQMRYRGTANGRPGPRFYKPTPRKVLYKRSEVIAWVEQSAHTATHLPA